MIRMLAVGFGALTALAVLGSTTPTGQAMLGLKPAMKSAPVTAIDDTPPPAPHAPQTVSQHPSPATDVRSWPSDVAPRASGAPHRVAAPPPARVSARPAPAQGGVGQFSNVAKILLNLPHVLDQRHVGVTPERGPWDESSPVRFFKAPKHQAKHHDDDQDSGGNR